MKYTVFALYTDNGQPYTTVVEAKDAKEAASKAQEQAVVDNGWQGLFRADDSPLVVAGVIEGEFDNLI